MLEECQAALSLMDDVPRQASAGLGRVLQELKTLVQVDLPRRAFRGSDEELEASKLLGQCRQCLCDLIDGWSVRSNLLNSILATYINVGFTFCFCLFHVS